MIFRIVYHPRSTGLSSQRRTKEKGEAHYDSLCSSHSILIEAMTGEAQLRYCATGYANVDMLVSCWHTVWIWYLSVGVVAVNQHPSHSPRLHPNKALQISSP